MSIEQVGGRLARVRQQLPVASLQNAAAELSAAATAMREAAQGSTQTEPEQIAGAWAAASGAATDVLELLHRVAGLIEQLEQRLGTTGTSSPAAAPAGSQRGTAEPAPKPGQLTDAQVNEIMKKLPERSDTNRKTSGRWVDSSGQEQGPLHSGRDEDSRRAAELLRKLGIGPARGTLLSTEHVEVKLAARLRDGGSGHVSVVINNTPCGGRYSCDRLLPQILKLGQAVTLHWPGGKKTYDGKGT